LPKVPHEPDTHDCGAAGEALDRWFNPHHENHEKQLRKQERELRLLHRIMGLAIPFRAWIDRCHVDLDHLYVSERQELGILVGCTKEHYAKFATDPMGRTRKHRRKDGTVERRPDARFPNSFIPGCFTEAQATQFRRRFNRPKRNEAEKVRRGKISKAKGADDTALEMDAGLDPMQKALVRVLDHRWKTPLETAKSLRRSVGWKSMKPQSRKRRINEMVPSLVTSGHIEINPEPPRRLRRRR
jgi:hypothetical protein